MKDTTNRVYEFIKDYIKEHHYTPTYREIGKGLGISSTCTVYRQVHKLLEQGMIHMEPEKPRTMSIIKEQEVGGWIPCSERLPKIYGSYIVSIKLKYDWEEEWKYETDIATIVVEGDGYIDGIWNTFNDWDEGQECHVIAWMPLPEPYRKE